MARVSIWALAMLAGLFIQTAPAAVVLTFSGSVQGPFSPDALFDPSDPSVPTDSFSLILNMNGDFIDGGVYTRGTFARNITGGTLTGGVGSDNQEFSLIFEAPDTTELILSVGSRLNTLEGFGASDWNRFFAGPTVGGLYEENPAGEFYIGELASATAVPEPATWGMMVAIVAGAAGLGWRRTAQTGRGTGGSSRLYGQIASRRAAHQEGLANR